MKTSCKAKHARSWEERLVLTTTEVGAIFGVDRKTIKAWIVKGMLPAIALPGGVYTQHRIKTADVVALLRKSGMPSQSKKFHLEPTGDES